MPLIYRIMSKEAKETRVIQVTLREFERAEDGSLIEVADVIRVQRSLLIGEDTILPKEVLLREERARCINELAVITNNVYKKGYETERKSFSIPKGVRSMQKHI